MTDHHNIDRLLKNRFVPNPSTNLSARIIAAAARHPDQPIWKITLNELSDMFLIPRPAYAIAACVFLGLVFALQIPVEQSAAQTDYFSFLTFDNGGWL